MRTKPNLLPAPGQPAVFFTVCIFHKLKIVGTTLSRYHKAFSSRTTESFEPSGSCGHPSSSLVLRRVGEVCGGRSAFWIGQVYLQFGIGSST